ncbi:hypothetical protein GCM10011344_30320 [Dokdonia pacifica]|uniref:Uncharacterized protein n=1 Tax=Dokdonia pacifica TaxID=1627892 RepID=A0A239BZQ0_9FLAO|nr:hypothetical protein [Dokdonia pacifica]GGG27435.1 hypothetical protein GCM10011344_30320 [Dokdonia pacifica]SNS12604.1 hypothetical protein SAMN06265376_1079 [Dokdonia pacifica]
MEKFDEFSSIEQAAMEQSPIHETDIRYNFTDAHDFIGKVAKIVETDRVDIAGTGVEHIVATKGDGATTPEVTATAAVEVAAGGVVVDTVFTNKHISLLKSIDKECSVDELIDLRSSLMKANAMRK